MSTGKKVVVLDNLSTGSKKNIERWLGNRNFNFIEGDLLNKEDIEKAIRNCDTVFHLAANPEVKIGYTNTKVDYEQNIFATYNLLEAMRNDYCKKLIFTSSSTVYGEPSIIPTPESYGPMIPISLYGASKLASESLIMGYSKLFGFRSVIVRLANVIGSRSTHGVIYDFIGKLDKNHDLLEVLGDGSQKKSYLYIDDCISALMLLWKKMTTGVEIFNAGSFDRISVLEIARIVIEQIGIGSLQIKVNGGVDGGRGWKGDVKDMLLDISKLYQAGWEPNYSSKDAVRLTTKAIVKPFIKEFQSRKKLCAQ